jgi:hypothetical protein
MVVLLLIPLIAGVAFANVLNTQYSANVTQAPSTALDTAIKSIATETCYNNIEPLHENITQINVSLNYQTLTKSNVVAIADVNFNHVLGYSNATDDPLIKGKLQYLQNNPNISASYQAYLKKDIDDWTTELNKHINTPYPGFIRFEISATLDNQGNININSVSVLTQDPVGNYVQADSYFKPVSDTEAEQAGYDSANTIVKTLSLQASAAKATGATPMDPVQPKYNRSTAIWYIEYWTSNPSTACRTGSTTVQDHTKYNSNYTWYQCDDCANYVSQALTAGLIPQNSSWQPYTYDWINVYGLKSFMTSSYYWVQSSRTAIQGGDPITITSSTTTHTTMCDYSNGAGYVEVCGHTNDQQYHSYPGESGVTYWHVVY